jgi:Outer membrane protein beta-barrel domain
MHRATTSSLSTFALAFAAALAGSLALPSATAAQTAGFEIIPYGGYRTNGVVTSSDRHGDTFSTDLQLAESSVYGVAVDIPLSGGLKLELTVNRQDSALEIDPGLTEPNLRLGDLSVTYAHVGLIWQWRLGQVQPYVGISGGLARLDPQAPGLDAEDRLSASLGGGVKIFFSDRFGARFEARGYAIDLNEKYDNCRQCGRYDNTLTQAEGTVGLIFAW